MPRVTVEVEKGAKNEVSVHARNHVTGNDATDKPTTLKPGAKESFEIPDEHHLVVSTGAAVAPAEDDDEEEVDRPAKK